MSAVRILLADDHTLVRAGIRALLEGIDGTQIVAEAVNGRDALALAKEHHPDLVVMDISMKDLNGIEATAQIVAEVPSTRVLILSMHGSEEFVRRALKAGASGYFVKDSAPLELQMAIDAIMGGEIFLSSRVSRDLVAAVLLGDNGESRSSIDLLTSRQREVLQMLAEGRSTKEIASALELSVKTVETHRASLMDRLGIYDLAGLVVFAARHKLIVVDNPPD
jgi:DNA-binding NarL/FixJ family response regulator